MKSNFKLQSKGELSLARARMFAVKWHNEQKRLRLEHAENQANEILDKFESSNSTKKDSGHKGVPKPKQINPQQLSLI